MSFNKFLSTFFPSPGKENLGEPERRLHLSHKAVQPLGASKDEHELAATFVSVFWELISPSPDAPATRRSSSTARPSAAPPSARGSTSPSENPHGTRTPTARPRSMGLYMPLTIPRATVFLTGISNACSLTSQSAGPPPTRSTTKTGQQPRGSARTGTSHTRSRTSNAQRCTPCW